MDGTERILLMGFVNEPATAGELAEMERDLKLARILLRGGHLTRGGLEAASRMRRETGLVLEHCLVAVGAVDFNVMLDALAERREVEAAARRAEHTGDGGHRALDAGRATIPIGR